MEISLPGWVPKVPEFTRGSLNGDVKWLNFTEAQKTNQTNEDFGNAQECRVCGCLLSVAIMKKHKEFANKNERSRYLVLLCHNINQLSKIVRFELDPEKATQIKYTLMFHYMKLLGKEFDGCCSYSCQEALQYLKNK
jgi:hypothetical protein